MSHLPHHNTAGEWSGPTITREVSTVLIVDDNLPGRMTLEAVLLREGYCLEMAVDGPEALLKAHELQPDLMLLDVMMPGMDGLEVCRRIRADERLAEMPVVIVTSLNDNETRMSGIEAGADDFISRPYNAAELRARVRTITRLNRYRRLALEREQRQQAEARTQQQAERLAALHELDMTVTTHLGSQAVQTILVEQIHARLHMDAVAILLLNNETNMLEHAASCGFRAPHILRANVPFSGSLAGLAMLQRAPIYVPNQHSTSGSTPQEPVVLTAEIAPQCAASDIMTLPQTFSQHILEAEDFATGYLLPLVARGETHGVLMLCQREPLAPDSLWLEFLETLTGQASIALDNAQLFENLQRSYEATLKGWVRALELRDEETELHSQRVTTTTVELARCMHFSASQIEHIQRGALLHDIGKLGIPDDILLKPGSLNEEEWAIMRTHPTLAYKWLEGIDYLRPALDIPYCHHEKWDGTGYPRQLKGEEIPLAARIFAVVDVWDALSSDRPYRKRWPEEKVYAYLRQQAGTHFDPQVVQTFLALQGVVW